MDSRLREYGEGTRPGTTPPWAPAFAGVTNSLATGTWDARLFDRFRVSAQLRCEILRLRSGQCFGVGRGWTDLVVMRGCVGRGGGDPARHRPAVGPCFRRGDEFSCNGGLGRSTLRQAQGERWGDSRLRGNGGGRWGKRGFVFQPEVLCDVGVGSRILVCIEILRGGR